MNLSFVTDRTAAGDAEIALRRDDGEMGAAPRPEEWRIRGSGPLKWMFSRPISKTISRRL